MLDDKSLLELCLHVSGGFENGTGSSYTTVAGNQDLQGLSAGILQWAAGQGTLQSLVRSIGTSMGWEKAKSFFSSDIQVFSQLPAGEKAVAWCLEHYISKDSKEISPEAKASWVKFLDQPESVAAQVQMAANGVLGHAKREVLAYAPAYANTHRPFVFFFDLVTQEGGMSVGKITIPPVPAGQIPDVSEALAFAQENNPKCHDLWAAVVATDNEAKLLLHYAYARSMLANPQYRWDTFSRRGTLACRVGIVHETHFDLTKILD